jgi:hypothetical protein
LKRQYSRINYSVSLLVFESLKGRDHLKHLGVADKGWSSSIWLGVGLTTPRHKENSMLQNYDSADSEQGQGAGCYEEIMMLRGSIKDREVSGLADRIICF